MWGHGEMTSGCGKGVRGTDAEKGAKDELNLLTVAYPKYYVHTVFLFSGLSGKLYSVIIIYLLFYFYFFTLFFSFLKS